LLFGIKIENSILIDKKTLFNLKKIYLSKFKNMRRLLLLFSIFILIAACGAKRTRTMLTSGNYDSAINNAISNLRSNKDKKGNQDYVYILEEAFAKAKERDLSSLNFLQQDKNPANLEKIYNTYLQLNNRQEKIKPLLPLKLLKEGRNAKFPFNDYNSQIIETKNALSKYLYENSKALLKSPNKMDIRKAYDDLDYINQINPGYRDVLQLMDEAQFRGTSFVNVKLRNESNMVIPAGLQKDLLDFNTWGMNDKWTVFHNNPQKGTDYDFGLIIDFRNIVISPEQIKEKIVIKDKEVVDGQEVLLDKNGNTVKDSLGKPIKVDRMKKVSVKILEFNQFKSCVVTANVDYVDFKTNQVMRSFPLGSEHIFQNTFATFTGDKRAADESYYSIFNNKLVPFPTNEQMIYNTAEDLKAKLKGIVSKNKFTY